MAHLETDSRTKLNDESSRFDQALALYRCGRLAEAKRIARRILTDEPEHVPALHLLGVALSQQGNHTEALRFIDAALRIEPESASMHNSRGNVLVTSKRHDEALAAFEKSIALNPQYGLALSNVGNLYQELGRFDDAILSYDKAIALNPDDAEAFYNRGGALRKLKRFEEALSSYEKAITVRGDYADAFSNRGAVLHTLGRHSEAVTSFDRAIALKPHFPEALCNRGGALHEMARFDEAIASYNEAVALKPDFAECFNYRGMSFEKLGRLPEALASFEKAIALEPDHAEAYGNRGMVLKELKRFEEALASYDRAIALKPDNPEAFNNRGVVLRELQCWEKAIESLETALALKPDIADAHNNMAIVLQDLGRLQQAQECYQQAIGLNPNIATVYLNLAELKKFTARDADLAAMEALAAKVDGLTQTDRMQLDFALGKAYGDLQDYKRSFTHLLTGNAVKRATISYDEMATFALFDRIEAIFTPERIAQTAGHGDYSRLPIFIVGMPRSGTTLIEQIIASHPMVYGAGEVPLFQDAVLSVCGSDGQSTLYPELVATLNPETSRQIASRYIAGLRRLAPTAERVTDKMVSNYYFLGLIHLVLPEAKIIHCVRDPLDTCVSCFSKLFSAEVNPTYDLGELGRYYKRYERLIAHWRRILTDQRILEVRYEDVIGDFEVQARRIIAHCDLPWDPRCLDFYQTNRPVRTASAAQVRQPIYATAVGRWRVYEEYLQPLLQALAIEDPATDQPML